MVANSWKIRQHKRDSLLKCQENEMKWNACYKVAPSFSSSSSSSSLSLLSLSFEGGFTSIISQGPQPCQVRSQFCQVGLSSGKVILSSGIWFGVWLFENTTPLIKKWRFFNMAFGRFCFSLPRFQGWAPWCWARSDAQLASSCSKKLQENLVLNRRKVSLGMAWSMEDCAEGLWWKFFSWSPLAWERAAIMSAQKEERKLNAPPIGIHWALIGKLCH